LFLLDHSTYVLLLLVPKVIILFVFGAVFIAEMGRTLRMHGAGGCEGVWRGGLCLTGEAAMTYNGRVQA
jgi:hypothetical protein